MQNNGYTIIEILISLVVVGVIVGSGLVTYRDFSRRQEVTAATRQVKVDLRLAQTQALAGQKPVGCTGTLNNYTFRKVSGASSPATYVIEANCPNTIETKRAVLPTNITMSNFSTISFKSIGDGTGLSGNITIQIGASSTTYSESIVVSPGGNIQ